MRVSPGRHRLLLRFILFNAVAFAFLGAIWLQGWLDAALSGYTVWLVGLVCAVFVFGLSICARLILSVNRELNWISAEHEVPVRHGTYTADYLEAIANQSTEQRTITADLLRLGLTNDIGLVRHIAGALVFLGLIGTVVGFIIALSAVDPEITTSVDKVAPMIGTLMQGMSIALYTTLIGAVLYLWLTLNQRMLSSGALQLYASIVALGEKQAAAP